MSAVAAAAAAPELRICTLDKQLLQNNEFSTCLMAGILMYFETFAFVCERTQHTHNIMYLVFTDLLPFFAIPLLTVVYFSAQSYPWSGCIHLSFPPPIIASSVKSLATKRDTE